LPVNLSLLVKTLVMNEGVGRELDPGFRLVEVVEPFARDAIGGLWSPGWVAGRARHSLTQWLQLGLDGPVLARRLMGQLERGELEVVASIADVERFERRLERMVNRLALSVLTAGFVVGLAILTLAYQPPGWGLL